MTLDSINAVAYTFLYIVPGFITSEVISALMPTKKYSEGEKTIQAIGYSVLNLAVWRWLFLLLQQHFSEPTPFFWLINTILVFATGGITGAVIGILRAKNAVRRLFEHFNINYRHPIPTAWDYKFSDGKSYWVEVFLSNDKVIRGLYSGRSFAWIFDKQKAEVIFVLENDKEVGFALYFHNFSTFLGRAGIYLEDLYVRPEYRGKGYGKAILKKLAAIAVDRGCGRLEWSCLNWNKPSIDFYLSLGAKPILG